MKNNLLLMITIVLCAWGVYSGNTDKAPLVLEVTNLSSQKSFYFYLQKPKMTKDDDQVKYDHDIWYRDSEISGLVIMLSKNDTGMQWLLFHEGRMSTMSKYGHQGDEPPLFPTEKNDTETWSNDKYEANYKVKSHIPAISNIKSSEKITNHLDFIGKNIAENRTEPETYAYVKSKLQALDFQFLYRKYSTINILLNVTTKKEAFDNELLQFKKTWYPKENTLPFRYQANVDKIKKTFDTRDYWIKVIIVAVVLIIIIALLCIVLYILYSKQVEKTDDMKNDEFDTYDEENPPPMPQSSNSEVSDSETVCPITPVISSTVSNTVSSLNLLSSEQKIDHPTTDENTNSVQSEKKVSNEIVTQQETDTADTLFSSKNIFDTDTNENTNSFKSAKETSVEDTNSEKVPTKNTVTEEKTQKALPKEKKKKIST